MPSSMRISVNNQEIEVSGQRPLIEELRERDIEIPSMCYAEGYEHHPSCMVCMVKDVRTGQMVPSCSTMPYEGMQIETDSDEVHRLRRMSLELLLSDHQIRCGVCEGKEKCRLRDLALQMKAKWTRYGRISPSVQDEQIHVNGGLYYEPAKCIRCGLCVYNTQDGFTFERRGFDMRVVIAEESKKHVSEQIAKLCPTGALFLKLMLPLMLLLTACRPSVEGGADSGILPDSPQLLWEYRHDVRTVAAPVFYDDKVFICDKHGQMKGLDADSGEEKFSLALGDDMEASFTIEDSTLYVGMIDGRIRSLSLADSTDNWTYETEGQIAAAPVLTTIDGQRRLFVGSYDNYMYTLSPQTGQLVHRVETGYYINGAATIWQGYALFGGCDAWLRIVSGATGQPTDSLLLDAYIPASPVIYGNQAYVADYAGNVYELTLSDGKISDHRKLLTAAADGDGGMLSVPVVTRDAVIVLTPSLQLLCIDREDGHTLWQTPLMGDAGECSPVLAGDKVLVCTKNGYITIHDISNGNQLWVYEAGEQITSRPIVGQKRFWVLTARGTLLCFGEGKQ